MDEYMQKTKLDKWQHEFRKKMICATNILDFYNKMSTTLVIRDGWVDSVFWTVTRQLMLSPTEGLWKSGYQGRHKMKTGTKGRLPWWIENFLYGTELWTNMRCLSKLGINKQWEPSQRVLFWCKLEESLVRRT